MKNTFLGLIMKLILTFLATWIAYGLIDRNTIMWIFIVALAVTLVNYLIGDVMILTRYGHMSATVANTVMAVIVAWIVDLLTVDFYMTWIATLVFIVIIFISEYFLHRYMDNDVADRR